MSLAELRSYTFLDSMQPQLAAMMCTGGRGYFPVPGVASLTLEVAPGMAIHRLLDRALKATAALPATIVVERNYGMLEVHHEDKGEVLEAGNAILDQMGCKLDDRLKPKVVSNTVIRSLEPMHAMIMDKIRFGSMVVPGESLLIFECVPAAYILLAANEAEKAANVKLVDFRQFGAFGRLYMAGDEANIDVAAAAATAAIESVTGKEGASSN
jgi:hypothetical protein